MARLGPFETAPRVAVGVSGGADSLALTFLLHRWINARGGRLTALTVDHGLRPESAAEAAEVGRILRPLGIAHRILRRAGPAPTANLQAEARRIRYELLDGWCARQGILHLALAHHLEDQAETLLLRLGRGSGLDGLAAMPPIGARAGLRLLRPLLSVPKARLRATLAAEGLGWIEDPSNQDIRHARVRIRALASSLAAEGLTAARLAATAARLGRARQALEESLGELLLAAVRLRPEGYAELDSRVLAGAPEELALRGLGRLLMTLGGQAYPPRLERLERLVSVLRDGLARGATLGGCRLLPRGGKCPYILVVRETRNLGSRPLSPGQGVLWDGRFEVMVKGPQPKNGMWVAALGPARALPAELRCGGKSAIPAAVRPSLPAIRDAKGLLAVPHLGYLRAGAHAPSVSKWCFAAKNTLLPAPFTVV